jgi:hypothetical protein
MMRTLASLGVLREDEKHRFALTPLGEALKTGAPGSARASILTLAADWLWRGWEHFLYSLETGKSGLGPGGQERSEEEYRTLLGKAGFRLPRVVPTESAVSVVEATPV